jgi:hypothetical protein
MRIGKVTMSYVVGRTFPLLSRKSINSMSICKAFQLIADRRLSINRESSRKTKLYL